MASTNIQTFPGKVGVSNTNPVHTLDIGSNVYIDDTGANKLTVTGNIHASGITIDGDITVIDTQNLAVKDPVILLASESTGTSDTGIIMKRADGDSNVAVFYDEGVGLKICHTMSGADDTQLVADTSNALNTSIYGAVTIENTTSQALSVGGGAQIDGDFQVGEVANLFVDVSTSNVGIGTAVPAYELDVVGNVHADYFIGDGSAISAIQSSNVSDFASNVSRIVALETDLGSNVTRIETLETDLGSNVTRITNLESGDLTIGGEKTFSSNLEVGTANLFVDTVTSRVGIGTTTPAYSLDVVGDINLSGDFYQGGSPFVSSLWTSSGTDLYYNSGSVGISNTAPDHDLSVGSNLYVHDTGSNVLVVDGNISASNTVTAQRLTLNNVSISTTVNLQQATDVGNVTSNTVQFTNPTTAFVTTGNVEVGGELSVSGNVEMSSNLTVSGNVEVGGDLTVTGNIYGPMTTFRAYSFKTSYSTSWTSAEGLAETEKTILTQNVTVPDTYTSVSPCTMRVFYMWKWFGEADGNDDGNTTDRFHETGWRTSITHNSTTYDMNTGKFGSTSLGFYVVSMTAIGYHSDETSTPDMAMIEGNFEINDVSAGDVLTVDLTVVPINDFWGTLYTNRCISDISNDSRERGTTSLIVWLEPIL